MLKSISEIRRANALVIVSELGTRKALAEALAVSPQFVGRLFSKSGKRRDIGDELARRIEAVGKRATNWLDQDHERLPPELEALNARYLKSDADIQTLIRLALDDPDMPLPKEIRPSLRTMLEGVRMAIAAQLDND